MRKNQVNPENQKNTKRKDHYEALLAAYNNIRKSSANSAIVKEKLLYEMANSAVDNIHKASALSNLAALFAQQKNYYAALAHALDARAILRQTHNTKHALALKSKNAFLISNILNTCINQSTICLQANLFDEACSLLNIITINLDLLSPQQIWLYKIAHNAYLETARFITEHQVVPFQTSDATQSCAAMSQTQNTLNTLNHFFMEPHQPTVDLVGSEQPEIFTSNACGRAEEMTSHFSPVTPTKPMFKSAETHHTQVIDYAYSFMAGPSKNKIKYSLCFFDALAAPGSCDAEAPEWVNEVRQNLGKC